MCGNVKEVRYKPKGNELCASCRSKISVIDVNKRWEYIPRKRYWYFCPHCSSIRELRATRKSSLCTNCNRTYAKKPATKGYFDLDTLKYIIPKIRHFRVCSVCGDVKEVKSKQSAQKKFCRKCKPSKPRKLKRTTQMSKAEIEKQRELNRKHREEVSKQNKKPKKQTLTDEEMIAKYLATHKVTVIEPTTYAMEA